jgi:hypothetical protein
MLTNVRGSVDERSTKSQEETRISRDFAAANAFFSSGAKIRAPIVILTIECPMLHIHNGDSSAATARDAQIPGDHIAWREALVCGPAPSGLNEREFIEVRAAHLANAYAVPIEKCRADLRAMHDALASFPEHDEVVLWFEHDLFCQVQLIYLLSWFAGREMGKTKLSLICINKFPGVRGFHGLGQLNQEQFASLWPERHEVTAEQLALGAKAWQAYSSNDARSLIFLRRADLSALPFLSNALDRHLERFPSTRNGLGRVENASLALIAAGRHKFSSLFPAFARCQPDYGFGDAQLYRAIHRLAAAPAPLLAKRNGHNGRMDFAAIFLSSFDVTDHGAAAIAGKEDFIRRNGIDLWLGGIHLAGKEATWRWDEEHRELLVSL